MASMPVIPWHYPARVSLAFRPLLQSLVYTLLEDILEVEGPPVGEGSHISGETPQAAEQPEFQLLSEIDRLEASIHNVAVLLAASLSTSSSSWNSGCSAA